MLAEAAAHQNRRLIVHMGVQKTGSTSFQSYLRTNRKALEPGLTVLTSRPRTATRRLGRTATRFSISAEHEPRFIETIAAVKAEIEARPGACLVSNENLPGAILGNGPKSTLYPKLEAILALLDSHFAPFVPEYVIYTRDMGPWKRSVYNQSVRSDGYADDYRTFLEETAEFGTWEELIARFETAVPGRAHVFRLEDETDSAHPGSQLLRFAGLDDAEIAALQPQTTRENQSLNPGSLEFMRQINALELHPSKRNAVARLVITNQGLFASTPNTPRPA